MVLFRWFKLRRATGARKPIQPTAGWAPLIERLEALVDAVDAVAARLQSQVNATDSVVDALVAMAFNERNRRGKE